MIQCFKAATQPSSPAAQRRTFMSANWSTKSSPTNQSNGAFLSLDTWALIVAFALVVAVKFNIWQSIPW